MTPDLQPPGDLTRNAILRRLQENYSALSDQFGVRRIGLFGSLRAGVRTKQATWT